MSATVPPRRQALAFLSSTLADTSETVRWSTDDGRLNYDWLVIVTAEGLDDVSTELAFELLTSGREDSRQLRQLWADSVALVVERQVEGFERFELKKLCPRCGSPNWGNGRESRLADMSGRRICRRCVGPVEPEPVPCLHPSVFTEPLSRRERMTALCRTFPYLQRDDVGGVEPFDPVELADELGEPWAHSTAARQSILFVLSVWGGRAAWWGSSPDDPKRGDLFDTFDEPIGLAELEQLVGVLVPRFDAVAGLQSWDLQHRAAYLAWAARPWWM